MFLKKTTVRKSDRDIDFRMITANLGLLVLIIYFIYHSLNGARGLLAYFKLKTEMEQQRKILASLEAERSVLEFKAKLLHPDTLDLDMLDEQARRDLSMIASDEKVIILNNGTK